MEAHEPIGLDITDTMIDRLAKHILSQKDLPDDAEPEVELFLLPVVEESIAQYRAQQARGFILVEGSGSPKRFYYVKQADLEQALKGVPPATLQDLARALQTYDPEREAELVTLRMDEVQHVSVGTGGAVRSSELRQRLPSQPAAADDSPGVATPPQSQQPSGDDLILSFHAYLQAETDAQARAILEDHPELLTDPQIEQTWQQMWRYAPTGQLRLTARHKLWKRKRRQYAKKAGEAPTTARLAQADDEVQWQPIGKLPDVAGLIDGMYADDQEQYTLYQEAREKPHVLDDATVQRAVRLYDDRLKMLATVFVPQFTRWQAEPLTDAQRQEVERLTAKTADLRTLDEKIMALLKEIEKGTIDAVMRKSDFELGVEAMYGKTPLTDKQNQLAKKIDEWVKGIERQGGGDEQILKGMADYLPTFKQIMDSSSREQMDKLCALYPGFYRFAALLNDLARGIQDGVIDVPR